MKTVELINGPADGQFVATEDDAFEILMLCQTEDLNFKAFSNEPVPIKRPKRRFAVYRYHTGNKFKFSYYKEG